MKKILFFIALFIFTGINAQQKCPCSKKNSVCHNSPNIPRSYTNVIFYPKANEDNIIRIYFDRMGDLYPDNDSPKIDKSIFLYKRNENYATLRFYFEDIKNVEELNRLALQFETQSSYDSIRQNLFKHYAKTINNKLNDNKFEQVIFLIHGFNNLQEEAEITYNDLKAQFPKDRKILFVEVYWDGLAKKNSKKIWSSAQPNSAYVGLGLRQLLGMVNSDIKITLIGHSTGASVATQVLFNPYKWKEDFQKKINDRFKQIPTPNQREINLFLLAAAIPGVNTFKDIKNTEVAENLIEIPTYQNISKIIIGYNNHDHALKKLLWKKIDLGLANKFGATSLGCNYNGEVQNTINIINEETSHIRVEAFDLSEKDCQKDHCVQSYIQSPGFQKIINLILD